MTLLPQLEEQLNAAAQRELAGVPTLRARLRPSPTHRRWALVGIAAGVVTVFGVIGLQSVGDREMTASAPPQETLDKSDALTREAAIRSSGQNRQEPLSAGELADYVAELQRRLPYPPGARDDLSAVIRPPRTSTDMGGVSYASDAELLGQYRAWCVWQRYWLATYEAAALDANRAAMTVLDQVPGWSAFRDGDTRQQKRIAAAARSDDAAAIGRNVALNCGTVP